MKNVNFFGVMLVIIVMTLFSGCSEGTNNENTNLNTDTAQVAEETIVSDVDSLSFRIPSSGQEQCYGNDAEIECASEGEDYYGNDAQSGSNGMSYIDNGDGTVTDLNTGLMWSTDITDGITFDDAWDTIDSIDVGGYDDWRIPTTKELYSLITFDGTDPSGYSGDDTEGMIPFINSEYFDFAYGGGGGSQGNRIIDVQGITSTMYESTVMGDQECFFGVNFADGRIKCYSLGWEGQYFRILYVRGDTGYGDVDFTDNLDGTVTEENTDLTWQQGDSEESMQWEESLDYCADLELGGISDWRLPNTKELQYIVDYSRSPDTTDSASIYDVFDATSITNEAGVEDYAFYWTSTTHKSFVGANAAAYVSFGRSLGYQDGEWIDVHGAGSQRSDPKDGDGADYPTGNGPQGDVIRGYNMVRCVTGGDDTFNANVEFTADAYLDYYADYEMTEEDSSMEMAMPSSDGDSEMMPPQESNSDDMPPSMDESSDRQGPPSSDGGDMMSAPPEAIDACANLDDGDSCSFSGREGTISGTCSINDGTFACGP